MCKFTFFSWLIALSYLSLSPLHSQTASFATWKDNKKAAYSIIHDDFGNVVTSIYDIAFPIATARGVKFSFGAITGACGTAEWTKARTMIAAGHDCINHSHSHKCGGIASDCTGVPQYGVADFPLELDQSTQAIQTNTGIRPIFFIHPYDAFTPTILNYLKNNLGYIGSRAGTPGNINSSDFTNYMNLDWGTYDGTPAALLSLNSTLDETIRIGGFSVHEFHGIDDASFGPITRANYTAHLDYVKSKIADGSVWSGTATEVITYKMQRDAYTIGTAYNATAGTINVNFTANTQLNTALLRSPVTVNVNLGTIPGSFTATQGTTNINTTRNGNIISFNIYPHQGNIVLKTGTVTVINPVPGCLKASYYSNRNLSGTPVIVRAENKIDYNWGAGAPITGLPNNQFAVRWEGTINPPLTGSYTFTTTVEIGRAHV